jgi:uncharacterized protein
VRTDCKAAAGVLALMLLVVRPHHAATTTVQPPLFDTGFNVRIPMRDGIHLSANVFRPNAFGRWPVILVRTPYNKGSRLSLNYRAFVQHGFALVIEDVRGRFASEGVFRPLDQEGPDGEDTINWIVRQPWSNGKIGMMGGSYLGIAQWRAALRGNPHLLAIFPGTSGDDAYYDLFYSRGGALQLGHRLLWMAENMRTPGVLLPNFADYVHHVPLRTADRFAVGRPIDFFQAALNHPMYDGLWRKYSTRAELDRIHTPVFAVGGWFDNFAESDLDAFSTLRRLGRPAYIVIGPWPHNMGDRFPGVSFGRNAYLPLRGLQLAWFDHWLGSAKGGLADMPPARYFTMGINRWQASDEWPPSNSHIVPFYLASRGAANTVRGNGLLRREPRREDNADEFVYDPRNPVPTDGGPVCCNPRLIPAGPLDQRPLERRPDVLVYTTPPLKRPLEVTGIVRAVLYVSTSAPDTDFTAKLVDVYPDGAARELTDGILRLRYRRGLDHLEFAHPGDVYEITIDLGVTSNVFLRGHRIRLDISSSNFPRFDRNPNTGRRVADDTEWRIARQTVHHGGLLASALRLPVVEESLAANQVGQASRPVDPSWIVLPASEKTQPRVRQESLAANHAK